MPEGINQYETVIILSAKLGEEGNNTLVEKFKERIAEHGTVESVDNWGKRRLAYPINKESEGFYTLINFSSTPDFTAELDRRYQITEGVLRTLIIKKDPKKATANKARKAKTDNKNVDVEAIAVEATNVVKADAQAE
ncbi:30S ribosomal protein S6 [Scatolibacter rhodanostii]|uniref:30S ribosomal protein S6 n=1 Tax=Scatolibacter rhodanostii TaxID=2014781 RepID=UPI000C0808DF